MSDLRPGDPDTIGQFRIRRRLGVGGMGVVFLAEGRSGPVALKVVRPELGDDPQFRVRFRREVQASFRVQSPTTVTLVDFDTEAEQPWMAVEYIDGPPLSELIPKAGPLDQQQQFALAVALADALLEIHEHGLVHRDLKPDNVLLPKEGPKVIDLGIAAAVDAVRLTAVGSVLGAPGWLSPEQVETGNATAASDVFAWGCTVGYAASGRLPFGEGAPHVLFYRALNSSPDIDFSRLSPALRSLVAAATERDPAGRPSSEKLLNRLLERSDLPDAADRARCVREILRRDWERVAPAQAPAPPARPAAQAAAPPARPAAQAAAPPARPAAQAPAPPARPAAQAPAPPARPAAQAPARPAPPANDDPRQTVFVPRRSVPTSPPPSAAPSQPTSPAPHSAPPNSAPPNSGPPNSSPPFGGPLLGQGPFAGQQGPAPLQQSYPFGEPAPAASSSSRPMVLGLAALALLVLIGVIVFLVAG